MEPAPKHSPGALKGAGAHLGDNRRIRQEEMKMPTETTLIDKEVD